MGRRVCLHKYPKLFRSVTLLIELNRSFTPQQFVGLGTLDLEYFVEEWVTLNQDQPEWRRQDTVQSADTVH